MWLEERHSELYDALLQGDSTRVLELSTKLSEGAERMVEMTGGMLAQLSVLPLLWRAVGARYGLRGERIGEASNPGPCLRRYRRGMNSTRAVEISSEEELLVSVRNVVPRLVDGEQAQC